MKEKFLKNKKYWVSTVVVLFTVLYLLATSSVTWAEYNSDSSITYSVLPDASFGHAYQDVYVMTEENNYLTSPYSKAGHESEISYYQSGATKVTNNNIPDFYGTVTLKNRTLPSGTAIEKVNYEQLYANTKAANQVSAITLENNTVISQTVPTIAVDTAGTAASYTFVPGSAGTYWIYVYYASNSAPQINYSLVDDYVTSNNLAAGTYEGTLSFTAVAGNPNWWKAQVSVNNLTWTGYQVTNLPSKESSSSEISDKYTHGADQLKTLSTLTLASDRYYNKWTITDFKFDTLLTLNWSDAGIHIAPVTKQDTLTVSADTSLGTIHAWNIYGEQISVSGGSSVAHTPLYFRATPNDSAKHVFALSGGYYDDDAGCYLYDYSASASVTAGWTELEDLPSVIVSDGTNQKVLDCYHVPSWTEYPTRETTTHYTLTADFTNADDYVSFTYQIEGEVSASGTLTPDNATIEFDVTWDTTTVTFTATSKTGTVKTITFIAEPSYTNAVPVARIGTKNYYYVEDALMAAQSGETIEIIADCSFYTGNNPNPKWGVDNVGYTVKNGVSFLLPYRAGKTTIATQTKVVIGTEDSTLIHANTELSNGTGMEFEALDPYSFLHVTLTIPDGVTVYVANGGKFVVGGRLSAGLTAGSGATSVPAGEHSNVQLEGDLDVQSGGVVSACGYILGSGTVNIHTGGKAYQPFTILDFRGGSYTVNCDGKICPFNRYTMASIRSNISMSSGAQMWGYTDMYTGYKSAVGGMVEVQQRHNVADALVIGGTGDNALIKVAANGTLNISYDADIHVQDDESAIHERVGKTTLEFSGGAEMASLTIPFTNPLTDREQPITTSEYMFPIPYNYDIIMGGSGTYTINNQVLLMPGATMTLEAGSKLNLGFSGQFVVMDGFRDHISTSETSLADAWNKLYYPMTGCLQAEPFNGNGSANFVINGDLVIGANVKFGGLIQTDGTSGTVDMQGTPQVTVRMGLNESGSISFCSGRTDHSLSAQVIDPETGDFVKMVTGQKYTAAPGGGIIESYTYTLKWVDKETEKNSEQEFTRKLMAGVKGTWYTNEVNIVTIMNDGSTTTRTAKFAYGTSVTSYYTDEACTTPATTVTADTETLYIKASDMKVRVDWASQAPSSYYPTLAAAVNAAVNAGDTVVVLNDLTETKITSVTKNQNITINVNGKNVVYSSGGIANDGQLTLQLAGGSVQTSTGFSTVQNNPGGTMTIVGDGGTISSSSTETASGAENTGAAESYLAVIRNCGTLTVNNVKLTHSNGGELCVGVINHRGTVKTLNNAQISAAGGVGIINIGGTIESISGGSVDAGYGIYNYNICIGGNDAYGYTVVHEGVIGQIIDTQVTATVKNALLNNATVGTIGGQAKFTAPEYTIVNNNAWNFDSAYHRKEVINSHTIQYYNLEKKPTIEKITGSAQVIASTGSYAIQNKGVINEISGTATVQAAVSYALTIVDGGYVGKISGNAYLTAPCYAVNVSGYYTNKTDAITVTGAEKSKTITTEYWYGDCSGIGTIVGDMSGEGVSLEATASDKDQCLYNAGRIESITGKVTITASFRTAITNANAVYKHRLYTRYFNTEGVEYKQVNDYVTNMDAGYIGLIGGSNSNVTIDAVRYCVSNSGYIGAIEGNVALSNDSDYACINNDRGRHTYYYYVYETDFYNACTDGEYRTRIDYKYTYDPVEYPSTIGKISGLTVNKAKKLVVNNLGYIGSITDCNFTAAENVIYNTGTGSYTGERYRVQGVVNSKLATSASTNHTAVSAYDTEYHCVPARIDLIDNCTLSATTQVAVNNGGSIGEIRNSNITAPKYAISNRVASVSDYKIDSKDADGNDDGGMYIDGDGHYAKYTNLPSTTEYVLPVIELIGSGNYIATTATDGHAVYSSGEIKAIDGGNSTVIYAQNAHGIYNYRGLTKDTVVTFSDDGTKNTVSTYYSARLGTIKNVKVIGYTRGIYSTGSSAYNELKIGELGEGLVTIATATTGSTYGFQSDAYTTVELISGGYYYSYKGTPSYALKLGGGYTYAPNHTISASKVTREAVVLGNTYDCYYIVMQCADANSDLVCDSCGAYMAKLAAIDVSADSTTELSVKLLIHDALVDKVQITYGDQVLVKNTDVSLSAGEYNYSQDGDRHVFTVPVASGEMTKYMVISFVGEDGTNPILLSNKTCVGSYSVTVAEYATAVLKQTAAANATAAQINRLNLQKELVSALISYGDYARTYFTTADGSRYADIMQLNAPAYVFAATSVDRPEIPENLTIDAEKTITGSVAGITQTTQQVFLDAAISMRVYFEVEEGHSISEYTFDVTSVNGFLSNVKIHEDAYVENGYYLDILNIPAAYLDDMYTITVTGGGATSTIETSVMVCLSDILEAADTGIPAVEQLKNLVCAMYLYNDAANKLFGTGA